MLWCLLGDVTGDVNHYETAWRLSEEKSSRVQRHWGFYYFTKKDVSIWTLPLLIFNLNLLLVTYLI